MLAAVRPISVDRIRILPPPSAPRPAVTLERDPMRVLVEAGDRLGIDRRARARDRNRADASDETLEDGRLTAAVHRPCPVVFALADRGRWAIVKGLSRAPHGLLVALLDPCDGALDLRDRIGVLGLRALARVTGRAGRPASALALVSSCVQAHALVEALGRRISTGGARTIELVPLLARTACGWREIAATPAVRIPGELAPLCDPRPDVLAVAVSPTALVALDAVLQPDLAASVATAAGTPTAVSPPERAPRARRGRKTPRIASP